MYRQKAMKPAFKLTQVLFLVLLFLGIVGVSGRVRAANPGDLDTTFSTDGIVYTDIGSNSVDSARAVAVQSSNNYVVVAGITGNDMAVVRYTDTGGLDTTFGTGGKVTLNASANADVAQAVAVDGNGKIIVAGYSDDGAATPVAVVVARYNADGTPDTGFGTSGVVSLGFAALGGTTSAQATAVAIDSSNNIIVAGEVDNDFLILRLNNTNGTLDTTGFNAPNGYYTHDVAGLGRNDDAYGVVIQSTGKIVAGGQADLGDHQDFAMLRLNTNGTLDSTFGSGGIVTTDLGGGVNVNDIGYALAVESTATRTDYLVLAGIVEAASIDVGVVRYTADGALDTTFSTDGKVITTVSAQDDLAYAVHVQSTGKVIVSGFTADPTTNENFMAIRYNTDGSLDTAFGTSGIVTTDIGTAGGGPGDANSQDEGWNAALTTANQLIIVGNTDVPLAFGDANFAVARYTLENTPPVVTDVTKTGLEDNDVTFTSTDFTDQFTDANGESLQTVKITALPTHGTLALSSVAVTLNQEIPIGQIANLTYTPTADYNGADSFGWNGSDGQDYAAAAASVNITLTAVNDQPSFTAGSNQSILEDSGAQTVANWATSISPGGGSDESGQTLTFTVTNDNNALFASQPAVGSNGTLTYTPANDAFGSATVTVTLKDNGGTANGGVDTSTSAQFTITVTNVNDAPSFTSGGNVTVNEDSGAYSATWATNISAGPGESDGLTFNVSNTNNGLFSQSPQINPLNGTLAFTPAADANGSSTVTVTLSDDGGTANGGVDTSAQVQFTITVNAVNDAPSFTMTASPNQTVLEDAGAQSVASFITATDMGAANESGQSVLAYLVTSDNTALFSSQPAINPATGELTYTPAADANGSATVTVRLQDDGGTANGGMDTSAPQQFTITVTAVNDPPSLTLAADPSVQEDAGAQTIANFATNISTGPSDESGQSLGYLSFGYTNAALFASGGQPNLNLTNGTLTFTPAADAFGTSTVTFTLQDDGGTANSGVDTSIEYSFVITVNAVNDPPTFDTLAGDPPTVLEDAGAQSVANFATGMSAGPANESTQVLTFNVTTNNNGLFASGPAIDATTGELTYTPAANANGTATVTVTLSDDGDGNNTSASQQFTITVTAVNDAPSFIMTASPNQTVLEDAGAQNVANFIASTSMGPSDESGQSVLAYLVTADNTALFSSQPAINPATGELTYTPAANANGSATVTVRVQDDGGTANGGVDTSASQQFTITVTAVNDAPSFTMIASPNQTVLEDAGAQSVANFIASTSMGPSDESGQSVLAYLVTADNTALFSSQPAINPSTGELTYTPAADANGSATVTVRLQDDGGTANGGVDTSASQQFTITVTAVNDAPSFTSGGDVFVDEEFASSGTTVSGWATNISTGASNETQTLTFNITNNTNPGLFTVLPAIDSSTGDLTFTAKGGSPDTATLTVTLSDDGGTANGGVDTSTAVTFTINVTFINDAPTFNLPASPDQAVDEDSGAQTVNAFATSIDPGSPTESGQILTFTLTTDNDSLFSALPAIDATTGDLTYTPAANAFGSATVTVTLKDNGGTANGGSDTSTPQTFTITVNPMPDAPVVSDFAVSGDENLDITFTQANFLGAFSDVDGDSLVEVQITALPANGTLKLNGTAVSVNQVIPAAQLGQLTFTPDTDWFGSTSFSWNASDGTAYASSGAVVNITVNQVQFFTYLPLIMTP